MSGRKSKVVSRIFITVVLYLLSLPLYSFAGGDQTFFGPKRYDLPKGDPAVYTGNFTGCSAARQVTLKVTNGSGNYNRIQSASILINGNAVASDSDFNSLSASFEKSISINNANSIKVVLNNSHQWYLDWFAQYKNKGINLFHLMENAEPLEAKIVLLGLLVSSQDLETLLAKLQNIENSAADCDNTLIQLINSLAEGCSYDCNSITDCLWITAHILALESNRAGLAIFRTKCIIQKGLYDAVPSWNRNAEYYKKKNALEAIINLLPTIDGELGNIIARLHQLKEKVELCQTKTPFIIVEISGNCDSTSPILSNPQPANGTIFNNNKPALSVQYADDQQGSGIDTTSVRMLLDGNDITAGSTVTETSVSYTPSSSLADGQHTVVVNVSDKSGNSTSITWYFTVKTTIPVANITFPQYNQYLNTPTITVTGNLSESGASVTVNGVAAQVAGTTFSLAGVALIEGANTITVQARDAAGNIGTAAVSVNLDTALPTAQITSQANGSYINTPSITVSGTINEAAQAVTVNGIAAQITGTTFSLANVSLAEGGNTITVEVKDLAGNTGTAVINVTLDTALPGVRITSPMDNAYLNTPTVTVTGTVSETVQTVTVNGVSAQLSGTVFTLDNVNLVNGSNNITVEARDLAGNVGTATAIVNLDTAVPVIQITSPANSSNVNTPIITVTGTVSEPVQTITVNGTSAQVTDKSFILGNVNLVNGSNNITVEATDLAGNVGTATIIVNLDTALPVVQITSPVNNSYVNTSVVTVAGTVSEPVQTITVNGTAAQVTDKSFILDNVTLVDGLNNIKVEATDLAGNTGSATISVNLDTAAPVIQITSPANSSNINTTTITVTGTVNETVQTVTVNGVAAQVMDKAFTISNVALVDGLNNIVIEAEDLAGNVGTAAISINLDTILPSVQITSQVNNAYFNTSSITVAGSVSETVQAVTINGVAAQISGTNYSLNGFLLTEGANTITVEVTDLAGNVGTATIIINMDTALPVVQITSPANNSYVSTPAITVTGSINETVQAVTVNGVATQVTGNTFTLTGVALTEGANTINVEARDLAGNIGTITTVVNLDTVKPVVQITSPTDNIYLNTPSITVTGTVSEPGTSVTVNGLMAQVTDTVFSISGVPLVEGANTVTTEVKDSAGNSVTTTITVNLDTAVPVIQVTTPAANTYTNAQVIAVAGTISKTVVSLSINGNAAAVNGTQFQLNSITLSEGSNTITVEARDQAGNIGIKNVPVILDTVPPVIQVSAPANNAYVNTATTIVTGSVTDLNLSGFRINNAVVTTDNGIFSLADFNLSAGANIITFKATDLAGNESSENVTVNYDAAAPIVSVTAPESGVMVNTPQITVKGSVSKIVGSVTINGRIAEVADKAFSLDGLNLTEGQNTIAVNATDYAGNTGTVNVTVTLDTTSPSVTVTAPSQAAAGANISVTNTATDNLGLNLCEMLVNNVTVWSSNMNSQTSATNNVSYTFSPDIAQGTTVDIQSRCTDAAGNTGTENTQVTISEGPSGPGYIQGQIYNDAKGLRLESAQANIYDAAGQGLTQITTQTDGNYFYQAAAGDYILILGKEGYTSVERIIHVRPEKNSVALDARLTPVSSVQNLIDANGGTAKTVAGNQGQVASSMGQGEGIELTVPANALTQQTDIRLTPISNQGLSGALPAGWSPIAALDIAVASSMGQGTGGHGIAFAQTATLTIPLSSMINFTSTPNIVLSSYDTSAHQWIVRGSGTVASDNTAVTAAIPDTNQYALVVPDNGLVPQSLTNGQALPAFSVSSVTDGISAAGQVIPPAAPPSTGLKAVGEIIVTPSSSSSPLYSGLIVKDRVAERFDLFTGSAVVPADYVQDVVLYQYPCVTNIKGQGSSSTEQGFTLNSELGTANTGKVGTSFPVTPSQEFTIIDLLAGKVSVEINLPATEETGLIVGTAGARIADAEGNVLVIPQNALAQSAPVQMNVIQPAQVSRIVGSDFTLLKALEVNLNNQTLAQTAEISIPVPEGFNPALPVIIARQIDVNGAGKLKLVALARVSGALITSVSCPPAPATCSLPLATMGIFTSGRYYFLQAKEPLGFVRGKVTDVSAAAYPSALVTSDTCSLVDLTGTDGNYLVASTLSGFTAKAVDIAKYDEGTETGLITAEGETVTVNITVRVTPPGVVSVAYTDNGKGIEPNTSITITFREPVDKSTITTDNIVLKDSSGNIVSCTFSINAAGNVVMVYPGSLLTSQVQYTLTISKNIKDLQDYQMSADVVKQFTIRDTTAPAMPAAGSITGTFPDAEGFVTITATQGSADPTYTVLIINESNGMVVSVKPESNGSFTGKIQAMLGDDIRIVMMDSSGNTTQISYIAFKNSEGKYLVTAKGGTVEGDSGTKLIIPEGALTGPTTIKITPVAQSALPHEVPAEAKFLAAVNVDTGGVKFRKPVEISVPVPTGMPAVTELQRPFIAQPQELANADGTVEKVYVVADSAKVVNGRLTTACAPFDGVLSGGNWVFIQPYADVMILSGITYTDMDYYSGYLAGTDVPLKNAVIRSAGSWNYVTRSNEDGHYAIFATIFQNVPGYPDRSWGLTAINPYTMYRWTSDLMIYNSDGCTNACNVINNFNIQLADKKSVVLDKDAPSISMAINVVPGQTTSPEFVAGTIPVGTSMELTIKVVDQGMGTATLGVEYMSFDGQLTQSYSAQLSETSSKTTSAVDENGQAVISTEYTYQTSFDPPIMGSSSQYFKPDKTGKYIFTIDAADAAGNKSNKTISITSVNAGDIPAAVEGAPTVTAITPNNDVDDVSVSTSVTAYFSELVAADTLNSNSFMLIDMVTNNPVDCVIYTSLDNGIMAATLLPATNLSYGRKYKIVLTRTITDNEANYSCIPDPANPNASLPEPCVVDGTGKYRMKLTQDNYEYTFTTKVPEAYTLEGDFNGSGSDIALYTIPDGSKTYAYVTAGADGWRVVDVTRPSKPDLIHTVNHSSLPNLLWRFTGAAVEPNTGILAMTEWITWYGELGNNFGYVRFYDINAKPEAPEITGQVRLAEEFSGVPMRVAISGNFAYISTINIGLQIVDIDAAKLENYDAEQPGAAIVGVFDTINASCGTTASDTCGQPLDVIAYRGGYVMMTTMKGYLLIIDVNMPLYPTLAGYVKLGANSRRAGATAGYSFTDSKDTVKIMDLAIAGGANDSLYVLDITNPADPHILTDDNGNYAIVKGPDDLPVPIVATEIVINKQARLAYVTAGTILYVIDIKDPYHPVLLNSIGNETYATGSSGSSSSDTDVSLDEVNALVEKNGWVYLATDETGMETVDLDPYASICPFRTVCECGSNADEENCCPNMDTEQDRCTVVHSSVNTRLQEYNREAVDLSLKAPGGSVEVTRLYYNNTWQWGHARHHLAFNRNSADEIKSISKGGVLFEESAEPNVYTSGTSRIFQSGAGWRWQSATGSWKEFDANSRMVSYGNRTGVTAKLNYDDNGRLISVADRNNRLLFTYEYNSDNLISAVTDLDGRHVEYTYTNKRLTRVKDVLGNFTTHTYDDSGRITSTTDAAGRISAVKYDDEGRISSTADVQGGGSAFVFGYDSRTGRNSSRVQTKTGGTKDIWYDKDGDTVRVDLNGRTVKTIVKEDNVQIITDEAGNVTRKEYDTYDNLIKVTYPDGTTASYEYEHTFNKVTKETDEKGIITTYEYDSKGNQTKKVEAAGTANARTTNYAYDSDGNLKTVNTAADANTTAATISMTYDDYGNMRTQTDAEGNTTTFTYDNRGNVLTRKDARNNTWSYTYDAANNLISATDPQNNTAQFTYDAVGNKIKEIYDGKQKTYTYDQNNKPLSVSDANGGVTTFAYDEDGRMLRQTDADGKVVNYAYDADGRLTETTDGNGNVISNVYDVASGSSGSCSSCSGIGTGQPSKTIFPTFTRQNAYDTRGRKVSETDLLTDMQPVVNYAYDSAGNLITKTDKENKATSYEYDALRRLTKVTDAQGQITIYTYDNRDNLTSLTDAKGQTTSFTYDKNNRLISETRPMGQQTGYQYNAAGLLIKKTDAKGQRVEYTYDNANRMTQIAQYNAAGSNAKNISFTYDSAGNLKTYSDGTTSATYTYDELYRKTQETVHYGSFSLTTSYAYNKNGTKKSFTYPNGTTINYTYDANNQITGVNVPYAGNVSYDAYQWTRPTNVTLPSASGAKQYAYDELMRTRTITSNDPSNSALMNYQYTYDKMDNIKTRNTQLGNYAYNYDNLYRLNEVKKDDSQTENYTYDQVGNRLTSKATTGDWTYNANNELLSTPLSSSGSTGGSSYVYDTNGNTIQRNVNGTIQNFVYDVDNRLVEVRDASNSLIAAYTYDPFGRRIKKSVSPSGGGQGEEVYYLYSDEGLIGEYDNTGSQLKIYGYKPDSTWSTDPLFMREGGNIYFYHNDHLGTPQKMTNISGQTVWSATYDAFGKATIDAASSITNNLRFPGQYFDAETRWHYNWNRFYEPGTGRYVTEDPIGLDGGDYNYYRYVWGDPINWFDNYGLFGDGQKKWKEDGGDKLQTYCDEGGCVTYTDPMPAKGHSDFTGSDKFGYTKEDYGKTSPYRDPERHFRNLLKSEEQVNKAIDSCNEKDFERAMHRGQDYFSHYKKGYRYDPGNKNLRCRGYGHACDGTSPDNDLNAWNEAEAWTKPLVDKWNKKCHCKK